MTAAEAHAAAAAVGLTLVSADNATGYKGDDDDDVDEYVCSDYITQGFFGCILPFGHDGPHVLGTDGKKRERRAPRRWQGGDHECNDVKCEAAAVAAAPSRRRPAAPVKRPRVAKQAPVAAEEDEAEEDIFVDAEDVVVDGEEMEVAPAPTTPLGYIPRPPPTARRDDDDAGERAARKRKADQIEPTAVQPPPPTTTTTTTTALHAPPPPPPPNLPADIHALLAMCNLAEYAEALVDAGYDDVQFLLEMSDDKIETILTEAGMAKVGHRKRFVSCVRKLRAAAA